MSEAVPYTAQQVAATIDHTLLAPGATRGSVHRVCDEALQHGFAGVCVAGSWIGEVAAALAGSGVKAVAVAGFPLGSAPTSAKAFETETLVRMGADEIDTVIHLGHAKDGAWDVVRDDLAAVVRAAGGRPVKAILETGLLERDEIVRAARAAVEADAVFVKTSTGFGHGGATVEVVRLLRETVGDSARVKASGGIHNLEEARAMLAAGADRLGASASVAIVSGSEA